MRDQLAGLDIPPSTYVDSGWLNPRADIAGLHLAQFPQSRELGNMKNPSDSALMKTERP
jgi:N-acetylmuramoyl-L-alanine amidase